MIAELIIVAVAFLLAAYFVAHRTIRSFRRKGCARNCGCGVKRLRDYRP
jgi:hypothetical protein